MANDFSGDSNCVALYKLDSADILDDGKGSNDLTDAGTVGTDGVDFKEGDQSADYDGSADRHYVNDADLSSDFPGKDGQSNNVLSVAFWCKIDTLPGAANYDGLVGKWYSTASERVWGVLVEDSKIKLWIGVSSGTNLEEYEHASTLQTNRWYHVGATYNGADKTYRVRIWDDTAGSILGSDKTGTGTLAMWPGDGCQFELASQNEGNGRFFDGHLDEVVIFKDILSQSEIDEIRGGTYGSGTTAAPTTAPPTTAAPTTAAPTTAAPTTAAPTTAAPTTVYPSTAAPTTAVIATSPPPPTTAAPTTSAPTTAAPTTAPPTTSPPTTSPPSTAVPTTTLTTAVPTTAAPTTAPPTTVPPTTPIPPTVFVVPENIRLRLDPLEVTLTIHGSQLNQSFQVDPLTVTTTLHGSLVIGQVPPSGLLEVEIELVLGGAVLGDYGSDWARWSKVGELNFTIEEDNLAGKRPLELKGSIWQILKLGNNKVVYYSQNGVAILVPSEVHMGMQTIYRLGVHNKGAVCGTDEYHYFVNVLDELIRVTDDGVEKLDYSEFLGLMANPVLSIDPEKELVYICDGTYGFIYGIRTGSFGEGPINVTGMDSQGGTLYVVSPAAIVTPKFDILTDTYDFGTRKPKTIQMIEVGTDLTQHLYSTVQWRKHNKEQFKEIPWTLVNPDGKAYPRCYGIDFRFRLKSYIYEYFEIDYLKIRGHIHGFSYLDTTVEGTGVR